LDEPFRFVSSDLQDRASQMVKELSEKLGLQFIIITHNPTLASYADKTFEVHLHKGRSIIS
jgi:DNA repair exonuclease SbcCD ATPase subunit